MTSAKVSEHDKHCLIIHLLLQSLQFQKATNDLIFLPFSHMLRTRTQMRTQLNAKMMSQKEISLILGTSDFLFQVLCFAWKGRLTEGKMSNLHSRFGEQV